MEKLHNGYVKIQPIEHISFYRGESPTYNEIGIVLLKDESVTAIEIGDKVRFDRFLAFKIPVEGKDDEYSWYIKYQEIISSEHATEAIREEQV
jgi:hypothetical protein